MFAKAFHKATHNNSIQAWSFHDDSFPISTKDTLFIHQLSSPDLKAIAPDVFIIAGICDDTHTAKSIHRHLTTLKILEPETKHLNANNINGTTMANKIVVITRHKLSLLVNVLFWWQEEILRWQTLEARKGSFARELEEAAPEESVEERKRKTEEGVRVLGGLQREVPSQRQEGRETSENTTGGSRRQWELMEMERRVAQREGATGEVVEGEGGLPAYTHRVD